MMALLRIAQIKRDGGTQTRAHLNEQTVAEYADAMADEDCTFPPIIVFYDGADHWLADGFHRVEASLRAGFVDIEADVRQGTRRDAILYSVGANAGHGLRRTNEDKRRAVMTLLNDEEWCGWSDGEIARRCGVSDRMVAGLRPSPKVSEIGGAATRTVTRGGTTYQQKTGNRGKRKSGGDAKDKPPREEPPPAPPPPRPAPRSQIATTVTQDTPEERRIGRHAGFVLEASDRLLAAVECWPDPADAAPHLEGYAVFLEQLPFVASWLGRLKHIADATATMQQLDPALVARLRTSVEATDEEAILALHMANAIERLLMAVVLWPDPVEAVRHLGRYHTFKQMCPEVADWLQAVAQLMWCRGEDGA